MKLCKDCAHYRAAPGGVLDDRCEAPENVAATDLVRGEVAWHWSLCTNARKPVVLSPACGPDADWFEPKSYEPARMRAEMNELQNSFGHGAYRDGLVRDRIAEIEKQLASAPDNERRALAGGGQA